MELFCCDLCFINTHFRKHSLYGIAHCEINIAAQRFALPDLRAGVDKAWDVDSAEAWKKPVKRAESRGSGARFVGLLLTRSTVPKDNDANFTRTLILTKAPKLYANQNACWQTDFMPNKMPNKTDCRNEEILCWPRCLLKKGNLYFCQNSCREKTSRFWKPSQPTKTTANETNTTNQNRREPKCKPKTLKPISATRQNQPETLLTAKTPPNEKAENLKTCLLKNIWPKTLFEKSRRKKPKPPH